MTLKEIIDNYDTNVRNKTGCRLTAGLIVAFEVDRSFPDLNKEHVKEGNWMVRNYPDELSLFIVEILMEWSRQNIGCKPR